MIHEGCSSANEASLIRKARRVPFMNTGLTAATVTSTAASRSRSSAERCSLCVSVNVDHFTKMARAFTLQCIFWSRITARRNEGRLRCCPLVSQDIVEVCSVTPPGNMGFSKAFILNRGNRSHSKELRWRNVIVLLQCIRTRGCRSQYCAPAGRNVAQTMTGHSV